MDFGVYVCSACAGIHREMTHKVKGIGMSNFNDKEVEFLSKWGNEVTNKLLQYKLCN
jgi:Putative GTPase activating protein for Arf